jgi:hypothetical protein
MPEMPQMPPQISEPDHSHAETGRFVTMYKHALQGIPPKARLAALAVSLVLSLVLIGPAIYTSLSSQPATLNLICRHNLMTAELSVFIDGKLSFSDHLSGTATKRFGIFGKQVSGAFSKSLTVPSGEHVMQVQLRSPGSGFDQTKQSEFNLPPGKEATVVIATQRNELSLAYEGPSVDPVKAGSDYSESVRWILLTAMGSAVSAAIGFFVQEFLRSKKAVKPVEDHR